MVNQVAVVKMPKLVIGMRAKSGFTLIEILVVLIIIGTVVTFAMLSFGDFGKSRKAKSAAEQMVQYITLMQQKAILENRLLGITVQANSYHAMKYIASQGWQTINNGGVYRKQPLPGGLQFYSNKKSTNDTVDIIIQTSGDVTPFNLYIGDKSQNKIVRVTGNENGEIHVHASS